MVFNHLTVFYYFYFPPLFLIPFISVALKTKSKNLKKTQNTWILKYNLMRSLKMAIILKIHLKIIVTRFFFLSLFYLLIFRERKMYIISKINLTPYCPSGITLQFDYLGSKFYISPYFIYFEMHTFC